MAIEIEPAYENIGEIKELFKEYAEMLGIDLGFQNYEEELKRLPGKYAPPGGRLYIARCGGMPAGCIALRPIDPERCEMKRLYVRPAFRKMGLGRTLAQKVIADARDIKYRHMLLDTLTTLADAVRLYRSLGFYETEPYYNNPFPETVYFRLDL